MEANLPEDFDAIVIGAGEAGAVVASRAVSDGLRVAMIYREPYGSTCVNVGCVPSKFLIHRAAVAHSVRTAGRFHIGAQEPAVDLEEAERELEGMAYQRVGERLARKLIDIGRRFGVTTVRGTIIDARLTQQELADMIGTTRETLAHTIGEFRRQALLTTDRHRVVIQDAERLLKFAERQ